MPFYEDNSLPLIILTPSSPSIHNPSSFASVRARGHPTALRLYSSPSRRSQTTSPPPSHRQPHPSTLFPYQWAFGTEPNNIHHVIQTHTITPESPKAVTAHNKAGISWRWLLQGNRSWFYGMAYKTWRLHNRPAESTHLCTAARW
jgi:hypothetical protein